MTGKYILFQAYGNSSILQECRYALLHLLTWKNDVDFTVVIYTDREDYFSDIITRFNRHELIHLEPGTIKKWKGEIDFVHRVKIEMLLHFFESHTGEVIYLDTDTYFKSSPRFVFDTVDSGVIVMHTCEGSLANKTNNVFKKWYSFLKKHPVVFNGERIAEPQNILMWNAGTVGLTDAVKPFLLQALELTDLLYPKIRSHVAEQFALSYIFQKNYTIAAADNDVFHYWDLKEFRPLLSYYFDKMGTAPIEEQSIFFKQLLPEKIFYEKQQYRRSPFFKKIFLEKWTIDKYKK